jgi:primase-polymerase (primpol)-like protein
MRKYITHSGHYADVLQERFASGILQELQPYPHFVTWKRVTISGDCKKMPFNPVTNGPARSNDPRTWGTLAQALTALRTGMFDGIGFMFGDDDPFTGIDLDHCFQNNQLTPAASEVVTDFWSYTELSPSKTGLHIIVRGTIPEGRRKKYIEMYSTGRYFTITTNQLTGTPETICQRQSQLDCLYTSLTPVKAQKQPMQQQADQLFTSDEKVLKKAFSAKNGQFFKELYTGNIAGFRSKSEADFTLVLLLLYWTNDDIQQVKRLFRNSGLYDEKTDRQTNGSTYLEMTIINALKKRY